MCDDQTIHTPENTLKFVPGNRELSMTLDKNWIVDELPFAYDVVQLLQNARQVEMLFSSLIEGSERGSTIILTLVLVIFFSIFSETKPNGDLNL